jgi:hypothetical protein
MLSLVSQLGGEGKNKSDGVANAGIHLSSGVTFNIEFLKLSSKSKYRGHHGNTQHFVYRCSCCTESWIGQEDSKDRGY